MRQTWRWFGPVNRVTIADQPLHQVAVPVDLAVEVGFWGWSERLGMTGTIPLRRNASSSQAAEYALSAMTASGL